MSIAVFHMLSFLIVIWSLSLAVVVTVLLLAYSRGANRELSPRGVSVSTQFTEFFGDQLHDILVHASRMIHRAKPHAAQAGLIAFSIGKRGHDIFVERVFGRMELKRGSSSSFFLKNIAEQKRVTQKDTSDQRSLR